jgi:hypothetical protein
MASGRSRRLWQQAEHGQARQEPVRHGPQVQERLTKQVAECLAARLRWSMYWKAPLAP